MIITAVRAQLSRVLNWIKPAPPLTGQHEWLRQHIRSSQVSWLVRGWLLGWAEILAGLLGVPNPLRLLLLLLVLACCWRWQDRSARRLVIRSVVLRRQLALRRSTLSRAAQAARMAPVATADCGACRVPRDVRHRADCPTVPKDWFGNTIN